VKAMIVYLLLWVLEGNCLRTSCGSDEAGPARRCKNELNWKRLCFKHLETVDSPNDLAATIYNRSRWESPTYQN
jgi:hypothetical protein